MRMVKIPDWQQPFTVIINGEMYTYPAGEIVEVEDFIADAIESAKFEPPLAPSVPTACPCGPSSSGSKVQTDWNQTDDTAADFLKNKPFGDALVEIVPETEIVGADFEGLLAAEMPALSFLYENLSESIIVIFDGVTYVCHVFVASGPVLVYGNLKYIDGEDTGHPFCVVSTPGMYMILLDDTKPHSVSIAVPGTVKISDRYFDAAHIVYVDLSEPYNYIYRDFSLQEKATLADLKNLQNKQVIIKPTVQGVLMPSVWFASSIIWDDAIGGGIFCAAGSDVIQLHPAEYTPTT